ncbi:hypothetical protein ACFE04_007018 [Oxalis oulophora]
MVLPTSNKRTVLMLVLVFSFSMAQVSSSRRARIYIVFTEEVHGVDPQVHYTKALAAVLGSETAAKKALRYTYRYAATGFAAELTPDQVARLLKQPGILSAFPSKTSKLDPGSEPNVVPN